MRVSFPKISCEVCTSKGPDNFLPAAQSTCLGVKGPPPPGEGEGGLRIFLFMEGGSMTKIDLGVNSEKTYLWMVGQM